MLDSSHGIALPDASRPSAKRAEEARFAYERDAMESEKSDGRFGVCSRESFRGWDVFDANV